MKKKIMILALIIVSSLVNCDITGSDLETGGQMTNKVVFTAEVNKEYSINEQLSLKINDIDDSRCPKGSTCIWAGEVKVAITINYGITVDTCLSTISNNELLLGSCNFKIISVNPYPILNETIKLEDYKVNIEIKQSVDN